MSDAPLYHRLLRLRHYRPGPLMTAVLFEGSPEVLRGILQQLGAAEGAIRPVITARDGTYPLDLLVMERVVSTNTTAAGGNASLMSL